jgi:hypothetical protein
MSSNVAGTTAVYTQGDIILQYPVEATTTFLFVILISAILEFGIDYAADVDNKYFQVMFEALNQEIMIVGVMILAMSFTQTLYDFPARWVLIFQWSMMCLFFMVLFFVLLIIGVLGAVTKSTKWWLKFETEKMDSGGQLSARELQYKLAFNKFQAALTAFGYDASQGIRFSEYLSKLQRRNIVSLTDLTWVCWVCLATLVILNTLRAEGTRQVSQIGDENIEDDMTKNQRLLNYMSFIVFIGYGTLLLYFVIHRTLNKRLDKFLRPKSHRQNEGERPLMGEEGGAADELEDPKSLLFRRSREATMEVLQVIILAIEWYTSVFFLSFSNEIVKFLGVGVAIPLFLFALLPAVIFVFFLPWTLGVITMLSSLGNNLDDDIVRHLVIKQGIPESEWPEHMRNAKRPDDDGAQRKVIFDMSSSVERPLV